MHADDSVEEPLVRQTESGGGIALTPNSHTIAMDASTAQRFLSPPPESRLAAASPFSFGAFERHQQGTTTSVDTLKRWRSRVAGGVVGAALPACLYLLLVILYQFSHALVPFRRIFFERDPTLSYPNDASEVSSNKRNNVAIHGQEASATDWSAGSRSSGSQRHRL